MHAIRFAPLLLLALPALAAGCASASPQGDEYSEASWSDLSTEPASPVLAEMGALDVQLSASGDAFGADDATLAEEADLDADPEVEDTDGAFVADKLAGGTYQNAVAPNCADPGILRVDGPTTTFYAACTGGGFPLFRSNDLVHWSSAGHIFTHATRPKWASGNFWAPEIHRVGNRYIAYFAATSGSIGRSCIGAATASSPDGPFSDIGKPLLCSHHVGLIDPHVFTDGGGKHFLYYKTDGNGLTPQEHTVIYGRALTGDGVSFAGSRHALIHNALGWEGDVVEAPWVVQRGSYFYMFYSGFRYCNHTYGVGVARSRSPLGPFHKKLDPILHSNSRWAGPGHNSIVSTGGHDYIVYHAWDAPHSCSDGGDRRLMLDRVAWSNGWPQINNGTPSRGTHSAPKVP